jgi:putative ABC transport system ATP-binding protein
LPADRVASGTLIHTDGLCRYYRLAGQLIRAVDEVSLSVDRGELLAVTGASGSGKSTLLNLLAGLDTPTSGHIEIDGKRLDQLSRRDLAAYRARRVGVVFQSFNLLPQHTALRNVEMALYFGDIPRRQRRRLAAETLGRLGLADRLEHRPLDLSGGEQQRVAIARALVKNPEVIFADEATGNLDEQNSTAIMAILRELNQTGITVVLVTHDVETATRVAGRVLRMHYGRVDGPGRPTSIGPGG